MGELLGTEAAPVDKILSLKEIAEHLGRPASTVRFWRDTFKDYIPVRGTGRNRRYPSEAVKVFESIASGYAQGLSTEAIEAQLSATYPKAVTIEVSSETQERNAMTTTTQQLPELGVEFFVAFIEAQRQQIDELRQALEEAAAARDEAQRKAQVALDNAVVAKEMAYKAQEALRESRFESVKREDELRQWIEGRFTAERKRQSLGERVRRMLKGDRRQ